MVKWLVSGWTIDPFLVTPEEWAGCLTGFHCVINNAHVPQGYRESPQETYLELCRELFGRLAAGERLVRKTHYPLLRDPGTGAYGPLQSVEGLGAYQDFLLLKGRIQALTRPLTLFVDGSRVRTRVRISEAARAAAGGFWFFQQEGISLYRQDT